MHNIHLGTPADVVAIAPVLVGHNPKESLVFLCLKGPRLRCSLRLDLAPALADPDRAVSYLSEVGGDGVMVLVFSEEEPADLGTHLGFLAGALHDVGLRLHEAVYVGSETWESALCPGEDCDKEAPCRGTIEDLRYSTAALETAVGNIAAVTDEPIVLPETDPALEREVMPLVTITLLCVTATDAREVDEPSIVEARRAWEDARNNPMDSGIAGTLIGFICHPVIRDRLGADLVDPSAVTPERIRGALRGELDGEWDRNRAQNVDRAILLELLPYATHEARPYVLFMLGHLEWLLGRSSSAIVCLNAAILINPDSPAINGVHGYIMAGNAAAVAKRPNPDTL